MINAHEFVCGNGYVGGGGGGDDDGGGDVVAAATVKPGEVAKRRRIIIVQALASNAEGRGFLVDGIGVCKALCQRAYGISDYMWNTTAADVYGSRPVKGLESTGPLHSGRNHGGPYTRRLGGLCHHQLSTNSQLLRHVMRRLRRPSPSLRRLRRLW
jgi:hypothetical protein